MKHKHEIMHHTIIPSHPVHLGLTDPNVIFFPLYLEVEGDLKN